MRDTWVLDLQTLGRLERRAPSACRCSAESPRNSGNDDRRWVTISDRTRCGYVAAKSTDDDAVRHVEERGSLRADRVEHRKKVIDVHLDGRGSVVEDPGRTPPDHESRRRSPVRTRPTCP